MNNELAPNQRIARLMGPQLVGLKLKKRGLWYRPGAKGYTSCECKAGRYTMEQAKEHEYLHGDASERVTIVEFKPINYFSPDLPIGERLKMWEKLTREQQCAMTVEALKAIPTDGIGIYSSDMLRCFTFALSPEFPSTFLRVVEGKG